MITIWVSSNTASYATKLKRIWLHADTEAAGCLSKDQGGSSRINHANIYECQHNICSIDGYQWLCYCQDCYTRWPCHLLFLQKAYPQKTRNMPQWIKNSLQMTKCSSIITTSFMDVVIVRTDHKKLSHCDTKHTD